jgi:hypothetical protein
LETVHVIKNNLYDSLVFATTAVLQCNIVNH